MLDLYKSTRRALTIFALALIFILSIKAPWRHFIESVPTKGDFVYLIIYILCIFFTLAVFYKRVFLFLKDLFQSKGLILELSKKDLQKRYLGSYLGIIWAFIQPTITIFVFWFVFQIGFRTAPVTKVPYILWLLCGMVPWFFFSESIQSAANSIIEYSFLVKKVVFRVSVLPIIRILSSIFIHAFFVIIVFIMFLIYGYKPTVYTIQVLYYIFASFMLVLGISWLTSSLVVFIKDLGHMINIILQLTFWMTPIFWSPTKMPGKFLFILKLNPMYYIVEGFRDSFITHIWFWQHHNQTVNFWMMTLSLFIAGSLLFRSLRPHFADVL